MIPDPPDRPATCERCGAPDDPAGRPPAAGPAAAEGVEPATHCEWCGAEYPVPEASPGS